MNFPHFAVVGHRGALTHAPENSIESFLLAERSGATELELDIRITRDGVPIVLHDATLARVAAARGPLTDIPVTELYFEQLRTVTLGSGHPTLTFSEVMDATSVELQVEIKDPDAVPALAKLVNSRPEDAARIRFTSFQAEALFRLREHAPLVPRGLIVSSYADAQKHDGGLDAILAATGASTFYCGFDGLTIEAVERLHEAGYEVHTWPLRTLVDVQRALELGVDGGTSDDPGLVVQWLAETALLNSARGAGRR
ncbi:glycerophosphodiester phosphodiesterase family protein [Cryobacterium sp. M15]|jgi:glycerophosphoryl diester phosphodiesterase|uniref:glycerophosphodiester phosphodiesterase n=1 Tax=Cryobacterium sp. M15 TaxID=2048291 RepID=UPI000CE4445E|nr:glycerophosphodiester phosphodiesterase family protein [Cryobacterium sp. M15]